MTGQPSFAAGSTSSFHRQKTLHLADVACGGKIRHLLREDCVAGRVDATEREMMALFPLDLSFVPTGPTNSKPIQRVDHFWAEKTSSGLDYFQPSSSPPPAGPAGHNLALDNTRTRAAVHGLHRQNWTGSPRIRCEVWSTHPVSSLSALLLRDIQTGLYGRGGDEMRPRIRSEHLELKVRKRAEGTELFDGGIALARAGLILIVVIDALPTRLM